MNVVKKSRITIMVATFVAIMCLLILLLPSEVYGQDYDIGDTGPAGGIIIFVDGNVRMEVASSDQSTGIQWYNGSYITIGTGLTGTFIGSGDDNTQAIVSAQGPGSYAAKICDDLSLGGYDDWFLPSLGSMYWIYEYRSIIPGLSIDGWYWSSSEYAYPSDEFEANAWQKNVLTDSNSLEDKASTAHVRAVRFFEVGEDEINGDENGNVLKESIATVKPWVRTIPMTCWKVWVNDDGCFEFVFIYEYKNNNWVKIYDQDGVEVFSINMTYGKAHFKACNLPDGQYNVKTYHNDISKPIQEFTIGKP